SAAAPYRWPLPSLCLVSCPSRRRHPGRPPSFPTRRSSDLREAALVRAAPYKALSLRDRAGAALEEETFRLPSMPRPAARRLLLRSEEHTSELQSRFDLVCRLLLEKKKWTTTTPIRHQRPRT